MKLKGILKTLSIPHLQRIEEHWKIAPAEIADAESEVQQRELLISNLYQRMQIRNAWETATADLDERQWNLVNFLAIHGGDLERGEVTQRFFDGDEEDLEETVHRLADIGIMFFDDLDEVADSLSLVGIPEPFLRFIDLPSFWEGYLGHFLKELSNNELKHIATQGLKLHPKCAIKSYLIHIVREALLDPKSLRKHRRSMKEGPAQVFDSLLDRGGVCVYRDLLELNVQRRYDHSRGDSIQWLTHTSGLVFTVVPGGNKYNNLLMVPRDIMYILENDYQPDERTFDELDSVSVVEKEKAPNVIADNSNTLLRDIVVFCKFVSAYPTRVLATGGIGKNDLKKVMPQLSRFKSLKYAEFLSLFLIEKKFIVSTGETYRVSQAFLDWIHNSQQAYQDIVSWWLTTTAWNEEFVEGNTLHIEPRPQGLVSIVSFRRVVLEMLADMPRDRWCVERGFYSEVLPKIQQEIPRRGDPLTYGKFTRSNELVVESIIAECLHWLGLVAVGVNDEKDLETVGARLGDGRKLKARGGSRGRPRKQKELDYMFRFTDLGRFVLSRPLDKWNELFSTENPNEITPLRFDVDSFIVQETHEVIVPPDLDLRVFYHLNQMSTVKSIDVMSLLAVTQTSLREAMDHGFSAEEIEQFLRVHSRTGLPDSLRVMIREVGEKHGQVNMGYAGGYLIVEDEPTLSMIQGNKKLAGSVRKVLNDHVLILNQDVNLRRFARDLQKVGFMPHLESENVQMRDEETFALTLSRDDMVRLIAAVQFVLDLKDERGRDVAHERMGPLLERLKADPRSFSALSDLADPLVSTWRKAQESVLEAKIEEVREKYSAQISHLVTNTVSTGASKYHFDGPNPASEVDDVKRMIDFAIENEFEMEIDYIKATKEKVSEVIQPESLEKTRLYAHCRTRDAYSVYRVDRIRSARLV